MSSINNSELRLILLHAFPLDARMWEHQLNLLPGQTVTPNLYQLGETLEEWASQILGSVGDGPLIVVGASMGASCALEMARQAPDRIEVLVLAGAKAGHRPEPALRDHYIKTLTSQGVEGLWTEIQEELIGPQASPDVVENIRALAQKQSVADLIRAVNVFHSRPDLTEVVSHWQKPLLAIGGDQGTLESRERTAQLAALAPQGKEITFSGCGHYMNLECPDKFNRHLQQIMQTTLT